MRILDDFKAFIVHGDTITIFAYKRKNYGRVKGMSYSDIIALAHAFKDSLEADPRVILLQTLDQQLQAQPSLLTLLDSYQLAQRNYQSMWEAYGDDSPHLVRARGELHVVKTQVDSHPAVLAYLKAYSEVRKLYQWIQTELFDAFKAPPKGCENI